MHIAKLSNAIKSYKRVIGCSSRRMLLFVLFQIPWYLAIIIAIRKKSFILISNPIFTVKSFSRINVQHKKISMNIL